MSMRRLAVLAVLLAGVACAPQRVVYTDDEVPLAEPLELAGTEPGVPALVQNDPPGRAVRLNYATGAVSRQPAGLDDWAPASINQPLSPGDSLWVPPEGQAELHAGATDLRLAQGTDLNVLGLDNHALQLGLPQGSLELRILPGPNADSVEVDTPAGAVLCARPGSYRVDVDPESGAGQVTVRSGEAQVTAEGSTIPVNPGSTLQLTGGDAPSYDVVQARDPDGFDQWCAVRDQREDHSESANYIGRGMTGYEDLDGQGTWQVTPEYGSAWAPRVPAGWAPYRDGRWVWSDPWGWTWVDDQPWGFAPSHYGRWANVDGTWMWLPWADGMKQAPPVYAPALVVFAGGSGVRGGHAPAGGAVAWFPLGPREPYLPAYPASPGYVRALNAPDLPPGTAVSSLPAPFHANQAVPGAMTVVPRAVFTGAQPVAAAALTVKGPAWSPAWKVGSAPALAPRQESVLAARPGALAAARPPLVDRVRPLLARRLPWAPVPFEARQQALDASGGRPLAAPAVAGLRAQGPAYRGVSARLAAVAIPGRTLAPARPGLTPGRAPASRLILGPAAPGQAQPSPSQAPRSGWIGGESPQPRGFPQGNPPQRNPSLNWQGRPRGVPGQPQPQGGPGQREQQQPQGQPEQRGQLQGGPGQRMPPQPQGRPGQPRLRAPARYPGRPPGRVQGQGGGQGGREGGAPRRENSR